MALNHVDRLRRDVPLLISVRPFRAGAPVLNGNRLANDLPGCCGARHPKMSKIEAAIVQISAAPRRTGTVKTLKPRGIILSYPSLAEGGRSLWIDGTASHGRHPTNRRFELDVTEILALFDRDERQEIAYPGMTREVFPHLVRFVRPAPGMSFVLYSRLDERTADGAIAEQIEYFTRLDRPFNWKVYAHDRPADLVQRLAARGFVVDETDAVMVLDVGNAPESLLNPPAADVRRLTDPAQLADVVAVLEPVWETDFTWVHERLGSHMAIPGYLSVYVAYVAGRPVSVGWTYFNQGHFAGLWGGSTLAEYRGQGLYTAVLAARVREARRRGVGYLTIDAGSMSRPIVARHGFEVISFATDCTWRPAAPAPA